MRRIPFFISAFVFPPILAAGITSKKMALAVGKAPSDEKVYDEKEYELLLRLYSADA